ncbi:hypothetical protein Tco_0754137 [Tanacetum coccineum]
MEFRMKLVQGAMPICEGSYRLTSLERQELLEGLQKQQGRAIDTLKFTAMPFGLTNAPAVFMELMSREEYESHLKMIVKLLRKEKLYVKISNKVEAEQRGSYLDVEGIKWSRWMKLFSEYGFEAKYHMGKANVDVVPWSRKKE